MNEPSIISQLLGVAVVGLAMISAALIIAIREEKRKQKARKERSKRLKRAAEIEEYADWYSLKLKLEKDERLKQARMAIAGTCLAEHNLTGCRNENEPKARKYGRHAY